MQTENFAVSKSAFEQNVRTITFFCQPFAEALKDPKTTEIMLNPDGILWHERLGSPMRVLGHYDAYRARALMNAVAACLGKELTPESPSITGEFPLDGSRFSGQIPPVVTNPVFALRKSLRA